MNINRFTQNSIQAVQNCEKIAADNGNQELAQEHLLYALLTQDDSLILKLFEKMNIQGQLLINRVDQAIGKRPKVQGRSAFRRAGSEQCVDPCRGRGETDGRRICFRRAPFPFPVKICKQRDETDLS